MDKWANLYCWVEEPRTSTITSPVFLEKESNFKRPGRAQKPTPKPHPRASEKCPEETKPTISLVQEFRNDFLAV